MRFLLVIAFTLGTGAVPALSQSAEPVEATHAMVVTQKAIASEVGVEVLKDGGNAIDAAVATAFALAVVHPAAGNIGGGGFIVFRPSEGVPATYDFRERAPATASPDMWLVDGKYDSRRHHHSHLAVGVPGTVAGLHLAWQEQGTRAWKSLIEPAIRLAEEGFSVSEELADSLKNVLPRMKAYPASIVAFSKGGEPYQPGDVLRQPDLALTLKRIAEKGPEGFYAGETARLFALEMEKNGGLITEADLALYKAVKRSPVRGTYRGYEVLGMAPPSSGGMTVVQMLNVLEADDLSASGFGSAGTLHRYAEAMRRAFADRARHLGDPEANPRLPLRRLTSKPYARTLRKTINPEKASVSSPDSFTWPLESDETTHFSVVDANRNAVSLTYTLEWSYGSGIVVPGAGFLLNNEMGDFNAVPGRTDANGLIGTTPNLAAPGKRMLSSMSPTILSRDGKVFMVTGSPGGRTIINTVLQTIVNVVDFGMNAQEAVDAGRVHHQWLPDRLVVEPERFSEEVLQGLREKGHRVVEGRRQGVAEVIVVDPETGRLSGGNDRRVRDGAAVGY
ncbi:MAG: gamma-glutamyltransferase [Verrucomicrobiota bacterium]